MPPATSPVASSGERKFAVLMFVDLTGYTDLCRRLDPEEVVATVHPVMSAMRRIVESEGGVVPSVAGDGFMAVFGVPAAVPDVAQRAVRAAAVIRELVAAQNAEARTFRIPDVHIGIAAGEVLVVPSDESSGWSLIGNAVNLASRLCDTAGPDEVLVDSHFGELAGVAGAGAHRRTITVKGVTGPLDAWSLPSGTTDSPLGAVATVFVDRTEALRDLDALAEESASRRTSHVVVVSGEAGIGKSRLVSHWLDLRAHRAVWTWTGSTSSGGGLGALLEQVAAATPSPAAAAAEIDRLLASSSTSSLRADPFPAVSAAGRRLLTEVASGRLLVVVIDDAHRADAALLDFVTGLREQPLDVPLLVLLTWRSDESRPPWPAGVSLSALPDDDAATLLAAALGAEPPAELSSAILSRVAGHPLMAVQSAAYLLENGIVDVVDGRCEVRSPAAVDVLPTSLRLFVSARIDRLPADDKAALQELSTYGESVPRDVMDQLAGAAVKLAVPRLIDRGLLRATADGWQFSHGLVQQVAYASLPRSVRAELHRRQWSVTEPELTGVRMHHALRWAQCVSEGDPVRRNEAVRAALTAVADHAEALFRTQAATSLAAAREAARLVEDTGHLFPVETARLHLLTARCLHELGRFEDALHNSDAARDLLAGSGAQSPLAASALLARGHALSRLRRFQAARQTLDEAMTLAESRGDEIARGHALRLLGDTWRHQSHPEFVSATERAYDVLSAAGDVAGATECACILAYLSSISTTARFERWRAAAAANEPLDERTQLWLARADAEAAAMRSDF
ncbi:MAG: AAA family ATPase, partial [Frankiales bacterium]|nr:AAA family ATPase [Frankiales bacterium]